MQNEGGIAQESIDILTSLPFATLEILHNNGIDSIGQLTAMTQEALLAIDGIEMEDVRLLIEALQSLGMSLS